MKKHYKSALSAIMILVISLLAGCSFFGPHPFTTAREYFSENTIWYQEVNMSKEGNLKALAARHPSIKTLIEGLVEKADMKNKEDNINFKKEIAPLINGYYAMGIELNEASTSPNKTAEVLFYGETVEEGLFTPLINKIKSNLKENDAVTETTEEFAGYTIMSWNFIDVFNRERNLSFVKLNERAVIVSNNIEVLKKALDRKVNSGKNITQNKDFREQFKSIDTNKILAIFINSDQYRKFSKNMIDEKAKNLSADKKQELEKSTWILFKNPLFTALKSTTLHSEVTRDGIAIKRISKIDHSAFTEDQQWKNINGKLLKYVPAQNYLWYVGDNFRLHFDLAKNILEADPGVKQKIAEFEQASAINLEKDFLSWMGGEYVMFVMPPKPFPNASPLQSALVIEVEDTVTALNNLRKLEPVIITVNSTAVRNEIQREGDDTDAVVEFAAETIGEADVRGYQFTNQIDMGVYYGIIPGTKNIFVTSSKSTVEALLNTKENNIMQNEHVKKLVKGKEFAFAYGGNLELMIAEMLPLLEATFVLYEDPIYNEKIKPALESIKYVQDRGILNKYGVESALQIILSN